jgi:hypothetical protein
MTKTDASTSRSTAHQLKMESKKQKQASGCSYHQLAFGLPPAPLLFP